MNWEIMNYLKHRWKKIKLPSPLKLNLFGKEANIDKLFFFKKKKYIYIYIYINESKDEKPKNYHPK